MQMEIENTNKLNAQHAEIKGLCAELDALRNENTTVENIQCELLDQIGSVMVEHEAS